MERHQADAGHLLEQVIAGDVAAGLADTTSEWKGERLSVFLQALDEDVVGKVHGKRGGLWNSGARSGFGEWVEISP